MVLARSASKRLAPGEYTVAVDLPVFVTCHATHHRDVAKARASRCASILLSRRLLRGCRRDRHARSRHASPRRPRRSRSSTRPISSARVADGSHRRPQEECGRRRHSVSRACCPVSASAAFDRSSPASTSDRCCSIDGRPSGVTNLGTLRLDSIDRIEILKGAASSVYGSSAMGGVVNVITRQSRGKIGGTARVGGGSLRDDGVRRDALEAAPSSRVDFDLGGTCSISATTIGWEMARCGRRPATRPTTARLASASTWGTWRLEGRGEGYRGRDIMTPGRPRDRHQLPGPERSRAIESGRAPLGPIARGHALSRHRVPRDDSSHTDNVTTTNPLDRPFLPYLSFESDLGWAGLQVKDAWNWSRAAAASSLASTTRE